MPYPSVISSCSFISVCFVFVISENNLNMSSIHLLKWELWSSCKHALSNSKYLSPDAFLPGFVGPLLLPERQSRPPPRQRKSHLQSCWRQIFRFSTGNYLLHRMFSILLLIVFLWTDCLHIPWRFSVLFCKIYSYWFSYILRKYNHGFYCELELVTRFL